MLSRWGTYAFVPRKAIDKSICPPFPGLDTLNKDLIMKKPKFAPWPSFDKEIIDAVTNVLRSGKVSQWTGPNVYAFEKEYARYLGTKHAIAMTNGSVTMDVALKLLGIGPGDEVVITCRSFVASASCAALTGALPVFADVDPMTGNTTAETIAKVVTKKTKYSAAEAVFQRLVDDIARLYLDAIRSKVRFAWETGQRIVETEQDGLARSIYGSALIPTLSEKLTKKLGPGFSTRNLWKMRAFYLAEPIMPTSAELDWSHHAELNPVKDKRLRRHLARRIKKEGLTSHEIREVVREVAGKHSDKPAAAPVAAKKLPPLKRPTGLRLGTCGKTTGLFGKLADKVPVQSTVKEGPLTALDLGFFVTREVARENLKGITVTDTPSYTYAAIVERVVDGDTLKVQIDIGFGITVHEKLRLRGINTPELSTPEGERAKKFVAGLLPAGSAIVLKSHRTRVDMHGRFVADVFYIKEAAHPREIIESGVYLNQELLDKGLAVRMSE